MTTMLQLDKPTPAPARRFALWELGFRPFYLLASVFAALSIALWALQFAGWLGHAYLNGPLWHAHEMVFGFVLAVIVGFLLTAGSNWTGRPTLKGPPLAALAALWLLARVLVLTPWGWAAAAANVAFPLAAAAVLVRAFVRARSWRNIFFVAVLVGMALADGAIFLAQLGVFDLPPLFGIAVALDLVLFVVAAMAGRVVAMFTNNGVPGAAAKRNPAVERAALGSLLLLIAADVLRAPGWLLAAIAVVAALAHLTRWWLWQPWRTLRVPLVWVLHVAYLWVPVHLVLRAGAEMGWVASTLAWHALTAGAIGGMIIGMMTRTARGHTARPLRADAFDVACYACVLLAGLVRVALPLAAPALTLHAVLCSAALWSAGFGLYALRYGPMLLRPRPDGRPG